MRLIGLLLAFLIMTLVDVLALAPPPINFEKEEIEINGKKYDITFDGKKFEMHEQESSGNTALMLGILLLGALVAWPIIFSLIFWNRNIFIYSMMAYLVTFLVVDIYLKVFKK